MPDPVTLTADPVLQSVSVELRPPASATNFLCRAKFKSYNGAEPVYTEVEVGFDDEAMPTEFFYGPVVDAVVANLLAAGFAPSEDFTLPPIATDLTVWDPTTNAPYP